MSQMELTFAKQCALATRDWDTFQAILRKCLKPATPGSGHKTVRTKAPSKSVAFR